MGNVIDLNGRTPAHAPEPAREEPDQTGFPPSPAMMQASVAVTFAEIDARVKPSTETRAALADAVAAMAAVPPATWTDVFLKSRFALDTGSPILMRAALRDVLAAGAS